MAKICIKCNQSFTIPGRYCNICRHKKLGKKCLECGIDIIDGATYCGVHNQSHRPKGNGYKIHASKIANGTYKPIGSEAITSSGYIMTKVAHGKTGENRKNGWANYKPKHRLIMEQIVGRELATNEAVHHIDGNKQNNNPDNLLLISRADHNKINHFLALLSCSTLLEREKIAKTLILRFPELFTKPPQNQL